MLSISLHPLLGRHGERRFSKKWFLRGVLAGLVICCVVAYTQRDQYAYRLAEFSRGVIGQEATARIESWYFGIQDRIDRWSYSLFGGSTDTPFSDVESPNIVVPADATSDLQTGPANIGLAGEVQTPAPLVLPQTTLLLADPIEGEGIWSTAGLPHSSPDDVLMAKTFLRPDPARPYAVAGILLVDKRRVQLHITGGVDSPGGDLGVHGPGMIPEADLQTLLVAWNGGFRGPHGGFGMYADGVEYRPLRHGFASVAVLEDGSILIGEWGTDLTWRDDMVAVRQNAIMLIDDCAISPRINEGNDTWGYVDVNTSEFITWRSAIGLTKGGDILVAAGNSLSADSLARALRAAGACYAMQLDINSPYVLTSLFFQQPDGTIESQRFMDSMGDNPARFLGQQPNDFMYLTLDESGYTP
jgi:hypothetical protein